MNSLHLHGLTSLGLALDFSESAFGELRSSAAIAQEAQALRERMREDGYLYLPGLLDVDAVMAARLDLVEELARQGLIDAREPLMNAICTPGASRPDFSGDIAGRSGALHALLYSGAMIAFYERLLGGSVKHFDYTWVRSVPGGGQGARPHCDIVFMGRGTRNLFTSWTPLGDIPLEVGGLIILENSHKKSDDLRAYLERDVDAYCVNRPDAAEIESGRKKWQDWDGRLSSDPVALREELGGRWLTANFKAGDVLVFGMATVHCSLDNRSGRFRLSSDSRYQRASEPADERWVGPQPAGHGPNGKQGRIC